MTHTLFRLHYRPQEGGPDHIELSSGVFYIYMSFDYQIFIPYYHVVLSPLYFHSNLSFAVHTSLRDIHCHVPLAMEAYIVAVIAIGDLK